jgi:peptidoglycan L-alanyl-D-glutamate endopeptidase CwlK
MPEFGTRSRDNLEGCESNLQIVANEVIRFIDFSVIEGHRSVERQHELFRDGKSQIDGVTQMGNHNFVPSRAMDLLPYPAVVHGVNIWIDRDRFTLFAGFVLAVAKMKGIHLVWGGDWNGDYSMKDTGFLDLPHFELKG